MSSNVERMTVTLTTEMAHAVRGVVDAGVYASSSEVVREALRDWQHKRRMQERQLDELRADVQAGIEDVEAGRVEDFDADEIVRLGREKLADRSPSA